MSEIMTITSASVVKDTNSKFECREEVQSKTVFVFQNGVDQTVTCESRALKESKRVRSGITS